MSNRFVLCRRRPCQPAIHSRREIFGVPLNEPAKLRLAVLGGQLRAVGVRANMAYGYRGLTGAMRADRSGARIALVASDRDLELHPRLALDGRRGCFVFG
jgi:histidyl-tRNA synthetase